jgi:phage-related protein
MRPRCLFAFTGQLRVANLSSNGCAASTRETVAQSVWTLMRVQFGWPIGMPLVRSLKDGLWEVRCTLPSQRIARLILCFHRGTLVVLHGFVKKTRKTPTEDLALGKRRMKEVTK